MPLPEMSELFLKYDFPETKDLCKSFLSLVSGILVFSITFSEKIVGFPRAVRRAKICLFLTWGLLLGAIICCGVGLAMYSFAAGQALYGGTNEYPELAQEAVPFGVLAGALFVLGMLSLALAGAFSIVSGPSPD
jgi:hypothetical protein